MNAVTVTAVGVIFIRRTNFRHQSPTSCGSHPSRHTARTQGSSRHTVFTINFNTMQTSVLRAPATQSVLPRNTAAAVPRHVARAAGSHGSRHHKQHVGTLKSSSDLSWSSNNPARQVATAAAPVHVAAAASTAATSSSSFRDCAVTLATVADATKALDVSVLHVEPIVNYTSYLVLCTGKRLQGDAGNMRTLCCWSHG